MGKNSVIDVSEFLRFILAGGIATVGNIVAVWLSRRWMPFGSALFVGIAVGLSLSFLLSKLFAFRSLSWERPSGEIVRFVAVYAVSCAIYWGLAVLISWGATRGGVATNAAELGGVLTGAASMALTSYFGHRFFTYRTHRSAIAGRDDIMAG